MTHQGNLGVWHIRVGKVIYVPFRLSMSDQDDPPGQDAVVPRSSSPACNQKYVQGMGQRDKSLKPHTTIAAKSVYTHDEMIVQC